MKKKYHDEENIVNFIKEFYPTKGGKYCQEKLNIDIKTIKRIVAYNNIRVLPEVELANRRLKRKSPEKCNVNPDKFINVETKYHAYILGLLWGDGSIRNKKRIICCQNVEADAIYFENAFLQTGRWTKVWKPRITPNRQDSILFQTSSYKFHDFLVSLGYWDKSRISHQVVLDYIPEHFKSYWLRGYIDADGSIFTCPQKRGLGRGFSLHSTKEQDWKYLQQFFINNGIKVVIGLPKRGSYIRSSDLTSFLNLNKLLYPEGWDDIGLKRKYDKLQEILNSYSTVFKNSYLSKGTNSGNL